jgi:hypothetical protein
MLYSLGQAAKAAGVSKSTISKALSTGRLSYVEKDSAGYRIDPAELHRVFPLKPRETGAHTPTPNDHEHHANTSAAEEQARLLAVELAGTKALLEEKDRRITDLEADRNEWRKQAQVLAITDQSTPQPASLFDRLFRGRGKRHTAA